MQRARERRKRWKKALYVQTFVSAVKTFYVVVVCKIVSTRALYTNVYKLLCHAADIISQTPKLFRKHYRFLIFMCIFPDDFLFFLRAFFYSFAICFFSLHCHVCTVHLVNIYGEYCEFFVVVFASFENLLVLFLTKNLEVRARIQLSIFVLFSCCVFHPSMYYITLAVSFSIETLLDLLSTFQTANHSMRYDRWDYAPG